MNCCGMSFGFWRGRPTREASVTRRDSGAADGGASTEWPVAAVWPQQGQRAFGTFLSRLGGLKDKADFDRFMADRKAR
jgi:uncharacterized protein DUF2852